MKLHNKTNYQLSFHDGLGHLIDSSFAPPTLVSNHPLFPKPLKLEMGGNNLIQHGQSQEIIWNECIQFLEKYMT